MQNVSFNDERAREIERKPYLQPVDLSISSHKSSNRKLLHLKDRPTDISDVGIGIQTDFPLEPGHMRWFNDGTEDKEGLVQCYVKLDNDYRTGINLDGQHLKHLDIATDLFMKRLQEIKNKCNDPKANPDILYKEVGTAISDVIESCEEFENKVKDDKIIRNARIRFHEKTHHILSKSFCINRARTWPQGYQGDYKTLEHAYKNTPLSEGIGYYLDLYLLNRDLGNAVRNRMKQLKEILRNELIKRQNPHVLNIACGSCREIVELAPVIEKSRANVTCIDIDNDALSFAGERLSYTSISPLLSNQIKLRKYNALRMFDHELNMSEFGKQDIIYSVGFFDYLESDFLARLFRELYVLLNPGGKLIASFKDANRYRHTDYHWIVDWDGFLQRTEDDFMSIFSGANIPFSSIIETREESGVIVFYVITK
jgi:SAM-dependent methyltransferase